MNQVNGRSPVYDVTIIGGGPAGLSAALVLGRALRRVLLLDTGTPRNAMAPALHGFTTRDGHHPRDVASVARVQLTRYRSVEQKALAATRVRLEGAGFAVDVDGGYPVQSRRVLLASGLADELPDIAGVAPLWGTSVLHCPYCEAFEVRDRPFAVLGWDADAAHLALHLTRWSPHVVLCTNGGPLAEVGQELRTYLPARGVAVRETPVARLETRDGVLDRVVFADGSAVTCHAMFIKPRTRQSSHIPADLGCELLADGRVRVDDFGQTSVAGVYAAGDMARPPTLALPREHYVMAAASGAEVATVIDHELLLAEVGLTALAGPGSRRQGTSFLPRH